MILRLLKNHQTTVRILRPGTIRSLVASSMAVALLLLSTTLNAQQRSAAEIQNSGAIYETYQRQLQENQRRLSGNDDAYQQQMQRNVATQVYLPPVHIAPQAPTRNTRPNRSLNGRINSVQNHALPSNPAQASLSDNRINHRSSNVASKASRNRAVTTNHRPAESSEHVFLQDRIANALSRRFGGSRANSKKKSSRKSPAQPERDSTLPENFQPVNSRNLDNVDQEQYASNEPEFELDELEIDFNEPELAVTREETEPPRLSVLDRSDDEASLSVTEKDVERQTEVDLAEAIPPGVFIADDSVQDDSDDSHVVKSSYEVRRRRTRVANRLAKRTRRIKAPRPIKHQPQQNSLRASEASILVGQEKEESLEDVDFDLPLDKDDVQDSLSDEELDSPLRPKSGSGTKPEQRDDLESIDDDDQEKDRVRSRLEDEFDDLDDLDDEDDVDIDDDEDLEVARPTDRPCNDFRDELLSTSIRDISLDISPAAYSATSVYGGPSRSWTDRSGNVIANGTMVDLRRGYVILASGQKIPYSKLGISDLAAVSDFWRLPTVCLLGNRGGSPYRNWAQQTVTWKASSLCHKPLFFENIQLERYGHSRGPFAQPLHSTVHFFTSLISLPYQTAITPANECQYALGFFRPGDCAPWLKDPIPISLEGARRQALLTTSGAFIP